MPGDVPETVGEAWVGRDVHPIFTLLRRHGRRSPEALVEVVSRLRRDPGDARASEQLIAAYAPLIWWTARRYGGVPPYDDLVGAAVGGLLAACLDPTVPLEPDALRKAANAALTSAATVERRQQDTIGMPRDTRSAVAALARHPDVGGLSGRERIALLVDRLGVDCVEAARRMAPRSLEVASRQLGSAAMSPPSDDADERRRRAATVRTAIRRLPLKDQALLTRRFGLDDSPPASIEELADLLGIGTVAARKRVTRAIAALRRVVAGAPDVTKPAAKPQTAPPRGRDGDIVRYRRERARASRRRAAQLAASVAPVVRAAGWGREEVRRRIARVTRERTGRDDSTLFEQTMAFLERGRRHRERIG